MGLLQEIRVPLIAVNDTTLTVVELNHANGDHVLKGSTIMVFETSKTTYNVEAETDGYISYLCEIDNDYEVNEIVANIFSLQSEAESVTPVPVEIHPEKISELSSAVNTNEIWSGETIFSNAAKKLMQEKNVVAEVFNGKDFVSVHDVNNFLGIGKEKQTAVKTSISKKAVQDTQAFIPANTTQVKLASSKKREIEYLSKIQSSGLTSTINTFVETEGIFTQINNAQAILKNSLLPVIIYEAARLLKIFPLLNGFYAGEYITLYNEVNIGFAIDIEKGLKVLNIRNADMKHLKEIESNIVELSSKYLDDKLAIEDLTDISFTITDLSAEEVNFFRPLVNMQNSAILGVSSIDPKLQRLILSMTFDHRVTEGKLVAGFLRDLKSRLESYRFLEGKKNLNNISCFKCAKRLSEDLSDTGFAKVLTLSGDEKYICQSCFKGF